MLRIDLDDEMLFGNLAAEDEDNELLESYFVDKTMYKRFRGKSKLCIARAKKGMGKSALLKKVAFEKNKEYPNDLIISINGTDLIGDTIFEEGTSNQQLVHFWKRVICTRISLELGKQIGIALTDDMITLVESAEVEGFKERNLIGSLVDRLKGKINNFETQKISSNNYEQLLERVQDNNDINVWLFVDDIDATFKNSEFESLKLSSFFTACRYLVNDIKGFYVRSSVRSDVWTVLSDNDEALDKVDQRQYMVDINWSEDEIKEIIAKRIRSHIINEYSQFEEAKQFLDEPKTDKDLDKLIETIFLPRLHWGKDSNRKPHIVINTLSNRRPRWAIQLCNSAAEAAVKNNRTKIGIKEITRNLSEYGQKRISDVVKEHEHQCKNIRDLINAFYRGSVQYSTEQLLNLIESKILDKTDVQIAGVNGAVESLDIAHFLFRIGFITAREDVSNNDYTHHYFEEDPSLLKSPVNIDKGYSWEVHPSFRNALNLNKN